MTANSDRYARQVVVPGFGEDAQARLASSLVTIVGAGGLGSPVIAYLAGAGVGTLRIVDHDAVERSNLHRQVIHADADVAAPKAASAGRFVHSLNPSVTVDVVAEAFTEDNAERLLHGADLVVDGSDNFATRYIVDDACAAAGIPEVWGSVLHQRGQVAVFGDGARYRDLYPVPSDGAVSCDDGGVLGPVVGVLGSLMALEALHVLTGMPSGLCGKVATFDGADCVWGKLTMTPASPASDSPIPQDGPSVTSHAHRGPAEMSATELRDLLDRGEVCAVDVRDVEEVDAAPFPGAVAHPLQALRRGDIPELSTGRVVTVCASGTRSAEAARILTAAGFDAASLRGGMTAWRLGI